MITDLAKDWSSGPPHDYQKFIPMIYVLELEMKHYEINLYANDQNIIDKPLIKEENGISTVFPPKGILTLDLQRFLPSRETAFKTKFGYL
jgi:hypothetical protein